MSITDQCTLASDATVWCWGQNILGAVGDLTREDRPVPIEIKTLGKGVKRISRWGNHACAVNASNELFCWGDSPQTGRPSADALANPQPFPVRIDMPPVLDVVMGLTGACAHAVNGHWWCWGSDNGDPDPHNAWSPQPVLVSLLGTDTEQIAFALVGCRCARKRDGSVWCWGMHPAGAVIPGNDDNIFGPARVPGIDSTIDIAAGAGFFCAVKVDGTLWCWGVGLEKIRAQAMAGAWNGPPVKVPLDGVSRVWAGSNHVCALVANDLWCWGLNMAGQVGDGTLGPFKRNPVRILRDVVDAAAGMESMCARTKDNTLWCWGPNSSGQTGDGTTEGVPCKGAFSGIGVCRPQPVRVRELCRPN
jgi:alpha-tubulin suppressor-like RCC1 family protein